MIGHAVYRDGIRVDAPDHLSDLYAACRRDDDAIAWVGMLEPSAEEFAGLAREFDLHALAVEDAIRAHQRPKIERYGEILFIVLRPARYIDEDESVEFGEVHLFVGPRFVVTVRHGQASRLDRVREALEDRPDLLRRGTVAIVHAILDRVVDDYEPVVKGLQNDIDEIENGLFDGGDTDISRRLYQLTREVIAFQRATAPLPAMLRALIEVTTVDEEERRYLRDVEDHALRVQEQIAGFRELLQNILSVNLTLETKALTEASIRQNEEVKKISAWAAIFFAPTLVGTIYGMNFTHMPELDWSIGYPLAILLMIAAGAVLYGVFKQRRWL